MSRLRTLRPLAAPSSAICRACWLIAILSLAACTGLSVPPGTSETRHLFDEASRPPIAVLAGHFDIERSTAIALALNYPPGTPVVQLVLFIEGIGGRCVAYRVAETRDCTYSNTSYGGRAPKSLFGSPIYFQDVNT